MASRPATPATAHTIALHKLPVQLRMLVRVMGEGPAFALVEKRGGTPVSLPKHLADAQWLVDLVGTLAAAQLVAELGGERLQLPKYDSVTRQLRHQRVLALRRTGLPLAGVATATGYTVRQVINICNRSGQAELAVADEGERQLGLFGDVPDDEADDGLVDQAEQLDQAGPAHGAHDPFGLARTATA